MPYGCGGVWDVCGKVVEKWCEMVVVSRCGRMWVTFRENGGDSGGVNG